ncbi:MAG TPA: rhomboid family intramembrane serine protease [Rubricoccaceae bacterium]|nr:rhomboid family intramembrane serine protease [Rubricoccaceae bacterium]
MLLDAPVTLLLLVLNGLVGVYTLFVDPTLLGRWAFRPYRAAKEGEWWRWLTAGFVHVGLAHMAFNLLTLFFFGPLIEGIIGPLRFLALYFGAELAANVLTHARYKNQPAYSAAGASGAISGVVFAFCLFYPLETIYVFFAIGMPAIVFAVLYVAASIYAAKQGGGHVAHEAHLGGALGGVVLTLLLYPAAARIFLHQLGF